MSGLFLVILGLLIWLIPYFILYGYIHKMQKNQKYLIDRIDELHHMLVQNTVDHLQPHISNTAESQANATALSAHCGHDHDELSPAPPQQVTAGQHPPSLNTSLQPPNNTGALPAQSVWSPQLSANHLAPLESLEPDEQSVTVVSSIWQTARHWFTGGNTIVRVGVLILLIGVVLLLHLLQDMVSISTEAWLSLIGLVALAMTGLGLRLRENRRGYALSLQGAGLATLYLTLFSAYRLYEALPSQSTFALLAVLACVTAALSHRQNALPLAVLGFGGGFFAPLLTSTEQGNVVLLFSYYLLVNLAVAWLAHRHTWKILNLLGAIATFGMAALWGWQSFDAAIRWPMQGLLLTHVLLYMFIVVRYSQLLTLQTTQDPSSNEFNTTTFTPAPPKTATSLRSLVTVDTGLLFGVPLVAFGLQAGLLHDVAYGLAVSSAVLAGLYLGLAHWLMQQRLAVPLLREGVLALGLGFLALVLPLALDATWTSTGWLIQGVALVWVGTRHQRVWQIRFGLALQALSMLILGWLELTQAEIQLGLELLVAFAGLLLSAAFLRQQTQVHATSSSLLYSGSRMLLWFAIGVGVWGLQTFWATSIDTAQIGRNTQIVADLWMLAALGLLLSQRMVWLELRVVLRHLSLLIGLLLATLVWWMDAVELLTQSELLWLAVLWLPLQLWVWLHLHSKPPAQVLQRDQTIGLAIGLALLSGWSFAFFPNAVALVLLPVALLLWLQSALKYWAQPDWLSLARSQQDLYWPLTGLLAIWVVAANAQSSGQFGSLPYIPLLNLLDGCLLAAGLWLSRGLSQDTDSIKPPQRQVAQFALGALAFWSLSGMVVRGLHQWFDTPLWPDAWLNDTVQTSLTIVWSATALLVTLLASRYAVRALWWVGIGLLGLVTAKLLLVDLSNLSALARVISFIGAGGLMLIIGYVAPLPPESASDQA